MENRISQGYWIWGQFDKDSMDELKLIYKKVNEVFNGPFFNVHITISGPLVSINNNIIDNFYSLKKKFQLIGLDLNKYSFSEDTYESFFIDVQNSKIFCIRRFLFCIPYKFLRKISKFLKSIKNRILNNF